MVGTFLNALLVVLSFCVHVCNCSVSGTVMDCSYRKCNDSKPSCAEDTTVLKMTGNGITHLLPGYFDNCVNSRIKEVYLDNNNISQIDKYAFQGLEEVNYIDLSGNNISTLDVDLQYTPELTDLSLAGNPLQTFTFHGTLKNLNLSSCQLPSDDNFFSSLGELRKLTTLDLSSNNLTNWGEITKCVVKMKELKLLYVADNPWECECPRDEATTEKMKGLVDGGDQKCASPEVVAGISLWNYTCPFPTTTTTTTTTSSTNTIPPTPTTESENITMDTNTNTTNTSTTNTTLAPPQQASNLNEASVYGATAFFFVVIVAALLVELHARIVKKRAGDNSLWWQDEDRVNGSAKYKYENIFPDD